jgi:hypothetical protein
MNNLLYLAIVLIVVWILARVVGFIAGALLNLLWILAIILFVVWLVRKIF